LSGRTWGYATPEALRALGPDLVFERMQDIVSSLITPYSFGDDAAAE